jgi:hypothetical protein
MSLPPYRESVSDHLSLSEEMGWGEFRWSLYAIRSEVPRYKDARGDLYLVKERSKRSPARGLP